MGAASTRARRSAAVLVALAVAAAVTLVAVPGTERHQADEPIDTDVLVQDVSVRQSDPSGTVESVRAVVRQDEAFLRVRLSRPDETSAHPTPALGGVVSHRDPGGSPTATCGAGSGMVRPVREGPGEVDLWCSGVLLPDAVRSVELSD